MSDAVVDPGQAVCRSVGLVDGHRVAAIGVAMLRRHPLPRVWLMTDERMGAALWPALRALPRGSGVVFRHYHTPLAERRRKVRKVIHIARTRRLLVVVAGKDDLQSYGAVGRHGGLRPFSAAVHSLRELRRIAPRTPKLILVSPLFTTRSHPGDRPLSAMRAAAIVRSAKVPAIALGGMDARRFRQVRRLGFYGWAAIDALTPDQKRKAVPI